MDYLKGEKVLLRPLEMEDLELLYKWENNPGIWHVSNTISPYSKYVLEKYIETASADIYSSKQLRLVVQKISDSRAIGFIDLFEFDPFNSRVGVGILIADEKERNQGMASDALQTILRYVQLYLGLKQIYCNITCGNNQSINLFKNAGFQEIGLKKDWIRVEDDWLDELSFQMIF